MIAEIHLKNFQSHPDTRLELHSGINAFVGASDKGKSAILRGLLWCIENRPVGDAHVSDWCKNEKGQIKADQSCQVKVTKRDGTHCTRIRSPKMNGYKVGETVVEAIKTEVPQEVQDFFSMGEVNIQRQRDIDFLVGRSPGDVAKFFNKLINLEVIDKSLSVAESRKRSSASAIRTTEQSLEDQLSQLARLDWVESVRPLMEEADKIADALSAGDQLVSGLAESLDTIRNLQAKVKLYSWVENAQGLLETAKSEANKLASASNQYNSLTSLVSSLAVASKTKASSEWSQDLVAPLSSAKSELAQLLDVQGKSYDLSQLIKGMRESQSTVAHLDVSTLGEDREALQTLKRRLSRFETDILDLSPLISGLTKAKSQMASAESELASLEAKRPPICPLCGGPYHKNNHEKEST